MKNYSNLLLVLIFVLAFDSVRADTDEPFGTQVGIFNGVPSYSNGTTSYVSNISNYYQGQYTGIKWQCVEYARRYYLAHYGIYISLTIPYASQAFTTWGSLEYINQFQNGTGSPPIPGDILCSNGGAYGHVAIVREVTANEVHVIQQNFLNNSGDNDFTLTLSQVGEVYTVGNFSVSCPVIGWLRGNTDDFIITFPTANDVLRKGINYELTWEPPVNVSEVNIHLYQEPYTSVWIPVWNGWPNSGAYYPFNPGDNWEEGAIYKIKMNNADIIGGGPPYAESGIFYVAGDLIITSPNNASGPFSVGDEIPITWDRTGLTGPNPIQFVRLEVQYYNEALGEWQLWATISDNTSNSGFFNGCIVESDWPLDYTYRIAIANTASASLPEAGLVWDYSAEFELQNIVWNQPTYDFGVYPVGQTSPPMQCIVINNGGSIVYVTVSITGVNSGDFNITSPLVYFSLNPDNQQIIMIEFTPFDLGTRQAELIASIDGEVAANASLIGEGVNWSSNLSGPLGGTIGPGIYNVIDWISVEDGIQLTIQPGTDLFFPPGVGFEIDEGLLHAVGTANDSIRFLPSSDSWDGIYFDYSATGTSIGYSRISGVNHQAVNCFHANPEIFHCSFIGNINCSVGGAAFEFIDSSPTISDCKINGNSTSSFGGAVSFQSNSNPIFNNCEIIGNSSGQSGGAICVYYSCHPVFNFCIINDNAANSKGGAVYLGTNAGISLYDCSISGNSANEGGGIYTLWNVTVDLNRCLISSNVSSNWAGGAFFDSCPVELSNCTIVGNTANGEGGGIVFDDCTPLLKNTIISDNTGSGIYFYDYNQPSVYYSNFYNNSGGNFTGNYPSQLGTISGTNLNGDPCDPYNNIFLPPQFVDPVGNDFTLQWNSPCIDAGDPLTNYDPDGTIADIGVYCFDRNCKVLSVSPENLEFSGVEGGANPSSQTISIGNFGLISLNFTILEELGWLTVTPNFGGPIPPVEIVDISIDITGMSSGIYDGVIQILSENAMNSPWTVPVVLNITSNPVLSVSPDELYFSAPVNGPNPDPQILTISNVGSGSFDYTVSEALEWLEISPGGGGPVPPESEEVVAIDVFGLLPGIYTGEIEVEAPFAQSSPVTISLTLEIVDQPDFSIILTPASLPIVIPANGDEFEFNIMAVNNTQQQQSIDVWTNVTLPNGFSYGPIINVQDLNMAGGQSIDRNRVQLVPASAPPGLYVYHAYIGTYPTVIVDEASFEFTKSVTDNGGTEIGGWYISGTEFPGEESHLAIPQSFNFNNPAPNPFNPETILFFELPEPSNVSLIIYDVTGREVCLLLNNRYYSPGKYELKFDGSEYSSGVYFAMLQAGHYRAIRKIVLIK